LFILQKEPFTSVKERIQKKLDIPEKEFEKVSKCLNKNQLLSLNLFKKNLLLT